MTSFKFLVFSKLYNIIYVTAMRGCSNALNSVEIILLFILLLFANVHTKHHIMR